MKSSFPVLFLGNIMEPAELVKNLGVILDASGLMWELQRVCGSMGCETAV